jgi:sulfate adenylyltransferase subunit 2
LRKRCCEIRKTEPLARALQGHGLWITGLRRAQSVTRSDLPLLSRDDAHGLMKLNPLVDWTAGDVDAYVRVHAVPVNPLHARGFPSIGCAPCTRAIARGRGPARRALVVGEPRDPRVRPAHDAPMGVSCEATCPDDDADGPEPDPDQLAPARAGAPGWTHLDALEAEAIHILREVAGECERVRRCCSPAARIRSSLLRLAEKAFLPAALAVPAAARRHRPQLSRGDRVPRPDARRELRRCACSCASVERLDRAAAGAAAPRPTSRRNPHQSVTLLDAIAEFRFDACIGGARRDEEKARAKERVFSFRDEFGQWDPKNQRPELWTLYNGRVQPGREHPRVPDLATGPSSTCGSTSARESIELPSIYFAHEREVVRRGGALRAGDRR